MIELVERRALEWARENGMKGEIQVSEPKKEDYGYFVTLQDSEGRDAQAQFTKDGTPSMWEMQIRR
jgi:hypothetical protein